MYTKNVGRIFLFFSTFFPFLLNAEAVDGGDGLTNPLESDTILELLTAILEIMLIFAIPIIVLFIIYAGFLYVTAQGDESKIRTAHAALTWSVVGGVIILAAKLIVDVIQATVQSL